VHGINLAYADVMTDSSGVIGGFAITHIWWLINRMEDGFMDNCKRVFSAV
jgi:hypothetical protein